jgi:hypothetical protein
MNDLSIVCSGYLPTKKTEYVFYLLGANRRDMWFSYLDEVLETLCAYIRTINIEHIYIYAPLELTSDILSYIKSTAHQGPIWLKTEKGPKASPIGNRF